MREYFIFVNYGERQYKTFGLKKGETVMLGQIVGGLFILAGALVAIISAVIEVLATKPDDGTLIWFAYGLSSVIVGCYLFSLLLVAEFLFHLFPSLLALIDSLLHLAYLNHSQLIFYVSMGLCCIILQMAQQGKEYLPKHFQEEPSAMPR